MSTTWPHTLRIFRPTDAGTPGGYSDDDGIWHDDPAAPDTFDLYEGPADVQDGGKMFSRDRSGDLVDQSDAVAFLKFPKQIIGLIDQADLKAEITWEDGGKSMADVVKVRRLDSTVWMKRL